MSFASSTPFGSRPPSGDPDWESTRLQTQISPRYDALADSTDDEHDIGRAVGDGTRELFVACEPADALIQQFDHLQPQFIAVHDLGVTASQKLLAGIAAAGQQPLQQLVIRRNGSGTVLATLQFVDCPATNGEWVRLYSTTVDADTRTRHAINRVLLGRSRVGIVLVGDHPAHALRAALEPWRDASLQAGWLCRRMLFLPLAGNGALPGELARFRAATVIELTLTPKVTKPAEVWSQLCTTWNLLQRQSKPGQKVEALPLLGGPAAAQGIAAVDAAPGRLLPWPGQLPTGLPPLGTQGDADPTVSSALVQSSIAGSHKVGAALVPNATASGPTVPQPTVPLPPTPMPVVGSHGPLNDEPLEHYLHALSQIAGVVSACAFDIASARPVGHAGARPGPDELARHGAAMLVAMANASRGLGLGAAVPDTAITLGQHHLLLRGLPAHPGMGLHVVLDKLQVALPLVQMQLRRLDEQLIIATRLPDAVPSRR